MKPKTRTRTRRDLARDLRTAQATIRSLELRIIKLEAALTPATTPPVPPLRDRCGRPVPISHPTVIFPEQKPATFSEAIRTPGMTPDEIMQIVHDEAKQKFVDTMTQLAADRERRRAEHPERYMLRAERERLGLGA